MYISEFNQSLIDYPVWSFIWEFIKVLIPTTVAILAIIVNNNSANKRDKINKKKDLIIKWRYELLNNGYDLTIMVDEINEAYINIMDAYDSITCEKFDKVFKSNHFKFMGHVRKAAIFADSTNISLDVKNNMEETRSMAVRYVKTLIEIKQRFRPGLVRSLDEDKELKEINEVTLEMYAVLNKLNKAISNDIIKLLNY